MINYIEEVRNMTRSGVKIEKIVQWTGLSIDRVRRILLENAIYPCKNDREYRYFKDALVLKNHEDSAYFYKDLSKTLYQIETVPSVQTIFFAGHIVLMRYSYCVDCVTEINSQFCIFSISFTTSQFG